MKNHSKVTSTKHSDLIYSETRFTLPSIDWGLAFRMLSRLVGLAGMLYLSYLLKIYADMGGVGALGSIGQYSTALFFFYMLLITGEKYQTWNFLYLIGLYGVVITF